MAKAALDDSQLTAQQLLEARVDAMMDPDAKPESNPKATPTATDLPPSAPTLPKAVTVETIVPQLVRNRPITGKPAEAEAAEDLSVETEPVDTTTAEPLEEEQFTPLNIDTSQSDAAIDDIVAQEAEVVLRAEDAGIAEAVEAADYDEPELKKGHPIFWFFIILLVIIAAIAAVVLTNPNLNLPFGA